MVRSDLVLGTGALDCSLLPNVQVCLPVYCLRTRCMFCNTISLRPHAYDIINHEADKCFLHLTVLGELQTQEPRSSSDRGVALFSLPRSAFNVLTLGQNLKSSCIRRLRILSWGRAS
jgi:hypothetical protein